MRVGHVGDRASRVSYRVETGVGVVMCVPGTVIDVPPSVLALHTAYIHSLVPPNSPPPPHPSPVGGVRSRYINITV